MVGIGTVILVVAALGIAGAFIGVPIVIAVLTICGQHASSRWVAELLGAPAVARD
jgi:predicted PurR-regulated permease PerM